MPRRFLMGGLLVLALAACGTSERTVEQKLSTISQALDEQPAPIVSCETLMADYKAAVKPILSKWNDATKIAASTSRVSLAPQVSELQEIRRELDAVSVPDCASDMHDLLNESMNGTIDAYLAFMREENQVLVNKQMVDANTAMEQYTAGVDALALGQEPPTPAPTVAAKTFTSAELGKLAFAPGDIADTTAAAGTNPSLPFEKGQAVVYTLRTKGSAGGTVTLQAYPSDTDAQAMVEQLHDIYSLDTPVATVGELGYTTIDSSAFQSHFTFSRCNVAVFLELQGNAKNYAISFAGNIDERLKKVCP